MTKVTYIILAIVVLALAFFIFRTNYRLVQINGRFFLAERAISKVQKENGLGNRNSLCYNCAMVFEFDKKSDWIFWMKDMRIKLDIIWIADGKIVRLEKNVPTLPLKDLDPKVGADKVLEINAGLSDKFGFKTGDRVNIF